MHNATAVTLSELPGLPKEPPKPAAMHLFDTYKLVTVLGEAEYSYGQSFAIMQALRALLVNSSEFAKAEFLLRGELENEVYLFQAAMSELRSETQITRMNETAALKQDLQALQREYELFERQLKEDLANMRHEVDIDVNNRKNETRGGQNAMDIKIQELNNRFTIMLGDLRTRLEGYKWDTTRKGILGLVLILSLLFAAAWYKGEVERRSEQEERLRKKRDEETQIEPEYKTWKAEKSARKDIESLVSLG
ncbi:hypothetical protein NEOLI_004435 [Neolecta irregularis DAH-3]|uniref:Uncharacterized protein n=1 Tax=Neolecta irregularis (strain DAH-3) TaxID=1198029 RepID=A0A1U7LLS1_NEOID|nr:hypothetical protein NEOLI_004435 [Neolecta irregularis DAH-3]|eukprot:OLL23610.1 hypothetical protein NEOLI_004435 [Neolecta irregularis DAH-3]